MSNCFHCRKELPASPPAGVDFAGAEQPCCSEQCASIAQGIIDRGLGEFYRHRVQDTQTEPQESSGNLSWESFERPAVMREFVSNETDGNKRAELLVHGVHCGACTWLIERSLADVRGVQSIQVNPATTRGTLVWNPDEIGLGELLESIAALGFTPAPFTEAETERAGTDEYRRGLRRLVVAGLGMMQVMSYAVALYAGALDGVSAEIGEFLRLISLLVATPVVFYAGAPFFKNAWNNLRARRPGMDVPVALAIGAAYGVSVWNTLIGGGEVYFDSATMFVFFLSATRFLEMSGRHRAVSLTGAMARHLPKTALRVGPAGTEVVGVTELESGDTVLIPPGQAFPADGVLAGDIAHVDEALLTGESEPVTKRRGQEVVAGSVNLESAVQMQVKRVGADTVIAGIGRMVTEARENKPRLVQLADTVGGWFVSFMLIVAAVTGGVWAVVDPGRAFEITLAVLVVTCPCALALATPAAFSVALSRLARSGLLLRRPGALQTLCEIKDVVFDKTGTLTSGRMTVRATQVYAGLDASAALQLAADLEAYSEHPLARAFPQGDANRAGAVRNVVSEGIEGTIDGKLYRIGSADFVAAGAGLDVSDFPEPDDASRAVYLGDKSGLLARFDIAEHVRDEAAAVVDELKQRGLRLTIASGDQPAPVTRLARLLGMDAWYPSLKAGDKLKLVRRLQRDGSKVAVVGDGVNDSPVLAGADVSVAMGGGTALAQHSADCVLISNSLETLADGFDVADRTMQVVRQNLIWALCYNITAVPLAATGLLAPWMAALGMSVSSLLVTLNALRLGRSRRKVNLAEAPMEPADAALDAGKPACCKAKAA